jgi:ATP-binding cassette subfamily F protein 3
MLNFNNITLRRGTRVLFQEATFTLHDGQKIGLTGANGTGKSSLFALIRGELTPDSGAIGLPPRLTIAHVAQETPSLPRAAIDYVLDGDAGLRDLEARLARAEQADDGRLLAQLHAEFDAIGGYTARSRAAILLHGLGFKPGQEQMPVSSFSGGWRMRLNLAQALMCRSDLLLLDEPTNHLDLETTLWLEEWLRHYPGTLLLIAHDREFLDAIAERILHIEQGGVRLYTGNYSDFERQRAEQLAQQQAAFERQQREIAHVRRFVERFRAKATKARQAQSRLKALARMELIAQAHVDSPFTFDFPAPENLPHTLLKLEKVAIGYHATPVLEAVNLTLQAGDRIGLLGLNGAGKSSLVKAIAGELAPLRGQREPAQDLRIGYFAQHQLEQLQPALTPLQHLQALAPKATEQTLRNFLGGFGFGGERADDDVTIFSGGERARLVLALLVYQRPNLLLLDEPTNHLDLDMRHALTLALQDYTGAIVLISHDRHLLRTVAEDFLLIADGRVHHFTGDIDDYRQWLNEQRRDLASESGDTPAEQSAAARKERRRLEAEKRQQLSPLRTQLKKLEALLDQLHSKKQALMTQLSDPALYTETEKERLKRLLTEQAHVDNETGKTEEEWLRLSTEIEAADQA